MNTKEKYYKYAREINDLYSQKRYKEALDLYYKSITDPDFKNLDGLDKTKIYGERGEKGTCITEGVISYQMVSDLQSIKIFGRVVRQRPERTWRW